MRYRPVVQCVVLAAGALLGPHLLAAPPTRAELRLDRIKYVAAAAADCLQVTVEDPDQDLSPSAPDSVQVKIGSAYPQATASGDLETLSLLETGASTGRFTLVQCLPVVVGAAVPQDGTLQVHRGDIIAAAYADPDNPASPPDPGQLDIAVDTALISGGTPAGQFHYTINPAILPSQMQFTPGRLPNEPPRPLAMVLAPGNVPQIFGADQVVLRSGRATEPADFLAERQGTLVEQVIVDAPGTPTPGLGRTYHLIRVDPAQQDLLDFSYLMELFGAQGSYVFSSDAAVRLLALLLEEQAGGRFVMHNPLLLPAGLPVTAEGDCDGDGNGGDNGFACDPNWMATTDVNLNRGILYMDFIDRNVAGAVKVAFIDGGFAGPGDYDVGDVPDGDNNPDFGAGFAAIPQGDCDADCGGSAAGTNPTMCAGGGGGGCAWHGTLTFSVAAAVADNSFGAIGVAGHARDAAGADGTSGVIDPVLLKIDYPYMTAVARAVEDAVGRDARIINISSGFPCTPLGGLDICDGGTRAALIATCFALLAVVEPIPGLSCGAMMTLFEESGVADFDLLQEAVDDAADAGILVVASGPENVTFPVLGTMGPFDAQEVEMTPCILPGVLCVGSIDDTRAPADYNTFGSAIDIWAPGQDLVTTPTPGGGGALNTFNGTSAAAPFITGVAALMKAIDPALTPDGIRDILQRTSRELAGGDPAGSCFPHPVLDPDGDGSPCVGFVDVLAALEQTNGLTLSCDGFEPDADDTPGDATDIVLAGAAEVHFVGPVGIHALPGDEDWYRFQPPDLGAPSTELDITLDVAAPQSGTLVMEVARSTGGVPSTIATLPAAAGIANFHAFFDINSHYYVRILADAPGATNDNCYGGTITWLVVGPGPQADTFDASGGNNSQLQATDLTNVAWVHQHFDDRIVDDSFTLVRQTEESWTLSINGLSIHTLGDVDFFRLALPDPADPVRWGGHSDIHPDPDIVEPMPECGVTSRSGLLGDQDTVMFSGALTVSAVPRFAAPGEQIYFADPGVRAWANGGRLTKTIACPRGVLEGLGLPYEAIFSFGLRDGIDFRDILVEYDLFIEYKIDVQRVANIPDWIPPGGGGGGGGFGMPCPGGFFGGCPGPDGWEVYHPFAVELPVDPPCFMDGCPDYFMFNWPADSPLELEFSSFFDRTYELRGFDQTLIAQAEMFVTPPASTAPALASPAGADAGPPAIDQADPPMLTKRLFVPLLPAGQYVLVVRGAEGVYGVRYVPRDTDADGILDVFDNCAGVSNAAQQDADQDGKGNACDCAPTDGTTWAVPAEVGGVRTLDSPLGPGHVALSWSPLAYQAGPGVRYDVLTGSLPALSASGAYGSVSCLAADVQASDITLAQPPPSPPLPNGWWYMVRGQNGCGSGTFGDGTPVPDPRDALDTYDCTPPTPQLAISKSDAPDPVQAGGLLTYTLSFQNTGNADATNVVITDSVPADTAFVSATGGGVEAAGAITWSLGTVPAGGSGAMQMVVRVTSPLPSGTLITNGAYSIDSAETAPVQGAAVTTTVVSAPVLAIAKTDSPDPVPTGALLTYTLDFQNTGNADATGVVVRDTVPAGAAFVSATDAGSVGSGGVVIWNIGSLTAGSAGSVQMVVRALSGSTLTNSVYSIDSAETAPVQGAAVSTTVLPPPTVAIDLDPSTPTTINSSRTISSTTPTLDVGVVVSAAGSAGLGDIARIVFGVINSFNTGGATVTAITPLAITDLMPPATSPYNATFAPIAGEFQFGGALVEHGLPGSPFTGGPVQFGRFRISFGTLPPGSSVRVYLGDHGPGAAAVRSASGLDISGDATTDGTPVGGVPGADQGTGAGNNYVDAMIRFGP